MDKLQKEILNIINHEIVLSKQCSPWRYAPEYAAGLIAEMLVKKFSFNPLLCDSVCPKCGDTGRCEPQTLDSPDGQECDCWQAVA